MVIIGAFMSLDGVMQAPGGPEEGSGVENVGVLRRIMYLCVVRDKPPSLISCYYLLKVA